MALKTHGMLSEYSSPRLDNRDNLQRECSMSENWNQHIGDDQLIYGLPKHMEAVAGQDKNAYWEIVPSANACATCHTMRGLRFPKYPGPVHPNCNCEIVQVAPPERQKRVVAFGRLQGYEDRAAEQFLAGQAITVELHNLGPSPAAVWIMVDQTKWDPTRYFLPGERLFVDYSKFGDTPMTWEVIIHYLGLDASTIDYRIWG